MPNLAISLHAPTDDVRGELVPLNKKYGVKEIIEACERFPLARRRRITFEYVLLAGVNDSPDAARRLAKLLSGVKSKVNLIPLNAAPGIPVRTSRPTPRSIDSRGFSRSAICSSRSERAAAATSGRRAANSSWTVRSDRPARRLRRRSALNHPRAPLVCRGLKVAAAARVHQGPRTHINCPSLSDRMRTRRARCGRRPRESEASDSCRSRPSNHRRGSGPDGRFRPAIAGICRISRADASRIRRPRSRTTAPAHLAAHRRRGRSRSIRVRETRGRASAASASRYDTSCAKSASVSPGKPTITSEPIDACGIRAADDVDERRRSTRSCRGGCIAASMSIARVLQRKVKMRRERSAVGDQIDESRANSPSARAS